MTFQDLHFTQRVRVLSWNELISIGNVTSIGIRLPDDTLFHNNMRYLCSLPITIISTPYWNDSDNDYLSPDIFQFDDPSITLSDHLPAGYNNGSWAFSPAMLAPLNDSISQPAVSFDQLIGGASS